MMHMSTVFLTSYIFALFVPQSNICVLYISLSVSVCPLCYVTALFVNLARFLHCMSPYLCICNKVHIHVTPFFTNKCNIYNQCRICLIYKGEETFKGSCRQIGQIGLLWVLSKGRPILWTLSKGRPILWTLSKGRTCPYFLE
jgi:hypothetical protein